MNNNEFNINNPFLSNDNNQSNNQPVNNQINPVPNTQVQNNQVQNTPIQNIPPTTPVNNVPVENTDESLGINQYGTQVEENPEKEKELDSILGLNGNNNEPVVETNNVVSRENISNNTQNNNLWLILIVFDIIGLVLIFVGSLFGLIGAGIALICFIASLIYIKKVKNIIVPAVISFIVVAIYVAMVLLATNKVNSYIDQVKKNAFIDSAVSFVDAAMSKVYKSKVIDCTESKTKNIKLEELMTSSSYLSDISVFGNKYDLKNSYVKIEAIDEYCSKFNYYIYITDGEYSIGKPNEPMSKEELFNGSFEIK